RTACPPCIPTTACSTPSPTASARPSPNATATSASTRYALSHSLTHTNTQHHPHTPHQHTHTHTHTHTHIFSVCGFAGHQRVTVSQQALREARRGSSADPSPAVPHLPRRAELACAVTTPQNNHPHQTNSRT